MKVLIVACAVLVTAAAVSQAAEAGTLPALRGFDLVPEFPTTSDFIVIEVDGEVENSGYTFPDEAGVSISGNQIFLDIFIQAPGGIVLPVVLPFTVPANVGFLSVGEYQVVADLFVDGVLTDTFNGSFQVAVPLPAAVWLFASGLVLLLPVSARAGLGRRLPAEQRSVVADIL